MLVNEPAAISGGKPGYWLGLGLGLGLGSVGPNPNPSGGRPRYWLPAGRVDAGESLVEAARRECVEEAGVRVRPCGVLAFMATERYTVDGLEAPGVLG